MIAGKKIVVTGAAGFIGSAVCKFLLGGGANVLGVIRNHRNSDPHLAQAQIDLSDGDIKTVLKDFKPDFIIHCAGKIREPIDIDSQITQMQDNYTATAQIIDAAMALGTKPKLVLVSTAAIYAPMFNSDHSIRESHPWQPSGHYGASKAAAAMLGGVHIQRNSLPICIAVPFNVIGKGQAPTMVPRAFIEQLAKDPEKIRTGDLSAQRDFIDVRDVATALIALLGDIPNGVYNIGTGKGVSIGQLLAMICEAQGISPVIQATQSSGEVSKSIANIDKIRAATGWEPKISLAKSLQDLLEQ